MHRMDIPTLGGAAAGIVLTLLCWGEPGDAQRRYHPEAVYLARICVGEAGFDRLHDDCAAIDAAIGERARRSGVSWREAARRATRGRHWDRDRRDRRRWLAWLDESLEEPLGLPARASWSRLRGMWQRKLEEADALRRGEIRHSCDRAPSDWGGPDVDEERIQRGIRRGYWEPVDCGQTHNTFLRIRRWG